jgi:hypothetical protein
VLAPEALYCSACGESQTSVEWMECRIDHWRGYLYGEFIAIYQSEDSSSLVRRSGRFRWAGRSRELPRTSAAEARLAELCRALELEGWERQGDGVPDSWYRISFRRFLRRPGPEGRSRTLTPILVEPDPEPELEPVPAPEHEEARLRTSALSLAVGAEPGPDEASLRASPPRVAMPVEPELDPDPKLEVKPAPALDDGRLGTPPLSLAIPSEPKAEPEGADGPWYVKPRTTSALALVVESGVCSRVGAYTGSG